MLKIGEVQLAIGQRIYLPEKWHSALVEFGKNSNYPYAYVISEVRKGPGKNKYYVCQPEEKKTKSKKLSVAFSEHSIRYLLASEVPESNIGFSFKEYLPDDGTTILITNAKNPNEVIPGILHIDVELLEEELITFTFKVENITGSGFADSSYYECVKKSTWKLLYGDESYMTDYEKMFKDTIVHKRFLTKSAEKLARYLENQGATLSAAKLRERAIVHDNSKLTCDDELRALSRIINDKSSLKDHNKQLTPIKKDAIELHWKHNSHHPEHYKSPMDMERLDIMEMCCDWHARSTQYNTNFIEFVEHQQKVRFHFPDWMFAEVMHYCKVLNSEF